MLLGVNVSIIFLQFCLFINKVNTYAEAQQPNIEVLTDKTFDPVIRRGRYNPWVLLFTVPKCATCNRTFDIFSNFSQYYKDEDNDLKHFNISFGKIDCFKSSKTAMRFDISLIPQVMLITNNTYYLLRKNLTQEILEEFIKSPGRGLIIPRPLTFTVIFGKFFTIFTDFMGKALENKGIYWDSKMTIILLVVLIVIFCIFEYYFINYCCRRKKKELVHQHIN